VATVPNATILTAAQIAFYAQAAGFSGNDLDTAVAIALAESSGNPNSYNPETAAGTPSGEGSYGLWQIYLAAHPEYAGVNLYDPQTNASAAYTIYAAAGGFSPWATYNSGAYQAYVGASASAAPSASNPVISIPGLTEDGQTTTSDFSMSDILWIGAAVLAGWFVFSLLD
jgi:Lysozyme like domain